MSWDGGGCCLKLIYMLEGVVVTHKGELYFFDSLTKFS